MAALEARLVLLILVILKCISAQKKDFHIPDVTIEAFKPKGFRASIPNAPGQTLFVFQGNVNRMVGRPSVGALKGEVLQATGDRWVYENPELQLRVGDIIYYYVHVLVNRAGYFNDNLNYTVTELKDRDSGSQLIDSSCLPTVTKVRGGTACGGQLVFEENFDSLRENLWQIEQYLPLSHPDFCTDMWLYLTDDAWDFRLSSGTQEYPFVSYQRHSSQSLVFTKDGFLYITPKLQQAMPGFTNESIYMGTLNLYNGCTSRAEECLHAASGPDILPPVVSGRITSTGFAFTYGTVHIKAKLPQGDWLYPELLLEPFLKKYGSSNYASGVVKIASALGNRELRDGLQDIGNKVLYGGPIMDAVCREEMLSSKASPSEKWGDEFHEYSVKWTPQFISLSVDGTEWARVDAGDALHRRVPATCSHVPRQLLGNGGRIAPFDDHFYITLGVAAGGISEFKDDIYSTGGRPKPWRNSSRKGMLNFWEDLAQWTKTWSQPELVVDYVKVVAL